MGVQALVLTCTSSPSAAAGTGIHGYIRVRLKNLGTGTAYMGDSGVTTGGYPFSTADSPLECNLLTGDSLWMCSSGGASPAIAVLRLNETSS